VLQNSLYVILQEPRNSAGLMSGILIWFSLPIAPVQIQM
jgi:hypothetical protein